MSLPLILPCGPRPRICLLSSVGGHFRELVQLRPWYAAYDHFYVVNDAMHPPPEIAARMIQITHVERSWRQVINLGEAWRVLRTQRPDLIVTTGASLAVPFAVVARALRIPLVFIEGSYAVEKPTLTGRIIYRLRLADLFLYQWPSLKPFYPRATYAGLIF